MAKNDVVLLDGIIDQRQKENIPSAERDEVFEFLVFEELLKDYDLTRDEIESGWIDGRDDGGIDGFYIFINGRLFEDDEDFAWPRSHAAIDVWLITCKHHATYLQAPLDLLVATIQELFDLGRSKDELHGSYSEDLLRFRSLFHLAYRRLSIGRPMIRFNIVYASRGDSKEVGDSVVSRARQVEAIISTLFSSCSAIFHFTGAAELVELHRKSKTFSLSLPFLEHLATGKDSYVLLVRLEDYWRFVTDETSNLRRYLFDSNVRDFLGTKGVNDDIAGSLNDTSAPDFWWLNNGVTILATNATIPGKTIQLQDIQIVNGLQTTETIFRHFSEGSLESKDRALLVKIIVSSDVRVRDRIIRATNNQNPVEVAALHATDKIQRDIEEILERHDWYYERRKNYYRNIGKPQTRFVTPIYIATAVVALIFKNSSGASRLKPKFMRVEEKYNEVFSSKFPIQVWPVLVDIFKLVDTNLLTVVASHHRREKFLSKWRPLVSLIIVARDLGKFYYSTSELSAINIAKLSIHDVQAAWDVIAEIRSAWGLESEGNSAKTTKQSLQLACCEEAARRFHIKGSVDVGRGGYEINKIAHILIEPLTPEYVNAINAVLPEQPWKPRMHHEVAKELNSDVRRVQAAIQQLIAEGKRHRQKDGVVYGANGEVLIVDLDRLPDYNVQQNISQAPTNEDRSVE